MQIREIVVVVSLILSPSAHAGETAADDKRCGSVLACTAACDRKDAGACIELGKLFERSGDLYSPDQASALYEKACDAGNASGCGLLAQALAVPHGTKRDKPRALALAERACQGGYPDACAFLANEKAAPMGKDAERARVLWEKACQQDDWLACSKAAELDDRGDVHDTTAAPTAALWRRAFDLAVRTCDNGNAEACAVAAETLATGRVGSRQNARTTELRLRACELGHVESCRWAANIQEDAGDLARAAGLHQKGCTLGSADACLSAARLLRRGPGPEAERAAVAAQDRGRKLAARACDHGDWRACGALARCKGTSRSVAQELSKRACDAGQDVGCTRLAWLLAGSAEPGAEKQELETHRRACDLEVPASCVQAARLIAVAADDQRERGATEANAQLKREAEILLRRAFELTRRSCDRGSSSDCLELAGMRATGQGTRKDESLAKKAAERGSRIADRDCDLHQDTCDEAVQAHSSPRWGLLDGARVAAILERACEQSIASDCWWAAVVYQEGTLMPRDLRRAASLFEKACGLGDRSGCQDVVKLADNLPMDVLGRERFEAAQQRQRALMDAACRGEDWDQCMISFDLRDQSDPAGAAAIFERACNACNAGNTSACFFSGAQLRLQSPEQALEALVQGCKLDDASCCESGTDLASKPEVQKPELVSFFRQRAADLLRRSCRRGNRFSCYRLVKLSLARVSPSDRVTARKAAKLGLDLSRVACERGDGAECGHAADVLLEHLGFRNPKRAAALYETGCKWGEASACISLAKMLDEGRGIETDRKRADEFYAAACKLGDQDSCNPRQEDEGGD